MGILIAALLGFSLFGVSCGELKVLVAPVNYGVLGENVHMQCSIDGQADSHILTWYQESVLIYQRDMGKDQTRLGPKFTDGRLRMASDADWSTLLIENSIEEDYEKNYRCNVRQRDDEQTGFTILRQAVTTGILELKRARYRTRTQVHDLNRNVTILRGSQIILEALASGYTPQPEIVWLKDNGTIYVGKGIDITSNFTGSYESIATSSRLEYVTESQDAGAVFGCMVRVSGEAIQMKNLPFGLSIRKASNGPQKVLIGIVIAIAATVLMIIGVVGLIHIVKRKQDEAKEAKSPDESEKMKEDDTGKSREAGEDAGLVGGKEGHKAEKV